MTEPYEGKTVLWVPRFWPAVGGTEFHTYELAQNIARVSPVCVVNHCTTTASLNRNLPEQAALSRASDTWLGDFRNVTLAPENRLVRPLSFLGRYYSTHAFVRRAYQYYFFKAYVDSATALIKDAKRIHFVYNGLTDAACLASQLAEQIGIPFIFTPNVLDTSPSGSAWASRSFQNLYNSASQIIALTDHEAGWLVDQGVSANKISVVPYGPILQPRITVAETEAASELIKSKYILFLARLVPEKGYQLLLKAFELLATRDDETKLLLVGPAEDSMRELIDAVNLRLGRLRVHLLPNVAQPLKTALIEEAALLCVPSRRESFGGAYIEAMACATPVVALDRPVSRCVIDHGVNGLLVENSTEGLVAALRKLLNDPTLAQEMGNAGQRKVSEHYAWPVVTAQTLKVYERAEAEHVAMTEQTAA